MEDDLRRGLLSRKGGFDKLYEECMTRIQRIKQKNDVIQQKIGTDIEETIRTEVHSQRKYIEDQISKLKDLMTQIQSKYKDPESKTKIKSLKTEAQKQIERNKVILKDLINKSFSKRSLLAHDHHRQNEDAYMEGGRINYEALQKDKIPEVEEQYQNSLITDTAIDIDYDIERKILLEKNQMINEVEQSTLRINEIINDMAIEVNEQGQNLDIITDQLVKSKENLVQTNKNLEEAATLQKKSGRKYTFLVVIILLVIIVVGGILFFSLK